MIALIPFPSPGGDYGLSDEITTTLPDDAVVGFRPLAGITVFRTLCAANLTTQSAIRFRPLAGITVFRTERSPISA